MKYLTNLLAAAKGITAGFRHSWSLLHREVEALRRMERAQHKAMGTLLRSTAAIYEMDKQAKLARKIEDDNHKKF